MNFSEFSCLDRGKYEYSNLETNSESRKWYQHDIDQLVYSNAFRKMQKKTQLLSERDPRCRSRLIHTLEVTRIAKEISGSLGLDQDLTEAIALGHDFGNTAFGRISNDFLNAKTNGLFHHEEISKLMIIDATQKLIPRNNDLRMKAVNLLENTEIKYDSLNIDKFPFKIDVYKIANDYYYSCISPEVLDGVVKHATRQTADTLEGQVVNYSDNIAYLSQDIDDLMSSRIISDDDIDIFEASTSSCQVKNMAIARGACSRSRSARIGVYIKYFVEHNMNLLERDSFSSSHKSIILGRSIPVLELSKDLECVINLTWEFISKFYSNELISIANQINKNKIESLWNILNDKNFAKDNQSYTDFIDKMNQPIYLNYKKEKGVKDSIWQAWTNAYFIAHLSFDEIQTILNLYQSRDYTFELDM